MDGATPIVVIDTDDILLSLQRASIQQNKDTHNDKDVILETNGSCSK
jgi:hypothetical protein